MNNVIDSAPLPYGSTSVRLESVNIIAKTILISGQSTFTTFGFGVFLSIVYLSLEYILSCEQLQRLGNHLLIKAVLNPTLAGFIELCH